MHWRAIRSLISLLSALMIVMKFPLVLFDDFRSRLRRIRFDRRRRNSGLPRFFPPKVVPADLDPLRLFQAPIAINIYVDMALFGDNVDERLTHSLKLDHQRYRVLSGAIQEVNSNLCCAADLALFYDSRLDD